MCPSRPAIAAIAVAVVDFPVPPFPKTARLSGALRWLVAQQMISDERYKDAVLTLGPLAYSPHQGEHTDAARKLLHDVEAKIAPEPSSDSAPKAE